MSAGSTGTRSATWCGWWTPTAACRGSSTPGAARPVGRARANGCARRTSCGRSPRRRDAGGLEVRNATCPVTRRRRRRARALRVRLSPRGSRGATPRPTALAARAGRRARRAGRPATARHASTGRLAPLGLLMSLADEAFLREWHDRVAAGVRPAQVKDRVFRGTTTAGAASSARQPAWHGEDDHDQARRGRAHRATDRRASARPETRRPDRLYDDPYAAAFAGDLGPELLAEVRAVTFPADAGAGRCPARRTTTPSGPGSSTTT